MDSPMMSFLILKDITLKLSSEPGHFLEEIVHLILELHMDEQVIDKVNLLLRESSPGTWDADQFLILCETETEFMLSVVLEFDTEERQVLGCIEFHGSSLYDRLDEEIEIPLMGDVNMFLKTKAAAMSMKDICRLAVGIGQTSDLREEETEIENLCTNAVRQVLDFKRSGNLESLEQAILQFQVVVEAMSEDDPNRPGMSSNLGACLLYRFERLGGISDLDNAIKELQVAVNLTPDDHPGKPALLSNLGFSLQSRFKHFGNAGDLNNAIEQNQVAANLTPDGHPDKPRRLGRLGNSLHSRFERFGSVGDLDNAITQNQAAVNLTPDGHPDKPSQLGRLGISLQSRFERFGSVGDLDNAIAQNQAAVNLTPDGHNDKPMWLNNLGTCLQSRFERFGNIGDLNNAIAQKQAAVNLTPDSDPDKPRWFNNLGISLRSRFKCFGNVGDLDNAIARQQAAVNLTPDGHPDKPIWLNHLGISLHHRFKRFGNVDDLNSTIAQNQAAVNLTPVGHPDKPVRLNNLAISLQSRFERFGNVDDLDTAIAQYQAAVNLTPDGHPDKPDQLSNLGISFGTRFIFLHHPSDAEAAISHYSASAQSPAGTPSRRLTTAKSWIHVASMINHPTLLTAYKCALAIIPRVAWLGLSIKSRHQHLVQMGEIARNAAATAISLQRYENAVEWLEQGRSVVWTQILQLRTPVDQLHDVDPNIADQLTRVSQQLDNGIQQSDIHDGEKLSREEEGRRYRALVEEWEEIVERIRLIPDFQDFLRTPKLSRLLSAAANGPVVVVNMAKERCDALALVDGLDEVMHIPLPEFTLEKATKLQAELTYLLKSSGIRLRAIRESEFEGGEDGECKRILAELWNCLVKPVLDSLAFSPHPDTLPHIWWCITGPLAFLPIHAAGDYDDESPGSRIQDYVISSYTPTLSALLASPKTTVSSSFKMLSVIEPSSGKWHIPNTIVELEKIQGHIKDEDHTILLGPDATKDRVMNAMKDCNWLHLACHGSQNVRSPTNSALKLRGDDLTLEEIIKFNLPHAECAFLSACQTVTGEETLSEEAVHIAGGMLLAGYRSVVATMWSIEDKLAPEVADEFYRHLNEGGGRLDNRKTAEALHLSVQKLRQKPRIRMVSWIPFVHLGY